jgi:hypothetical protein
MAVVGHFSFSRSKPPQATKIAPHTHLVLYKYPTNSKSPPLAAHQFSDQETAQNEETTMMPPLSTNNSRTNLQLLQ